MKYLTTRKRKMLWPYESYVPYYNARRFMLKFQNEDSKLKTCFFHKVFSECTEIWVECQKTILELDDKKTIRLKMFLKNLETSYSQWRESVLIRGNQNWRTISEIRYLITGRIQGPLLGKFSWTRSTIYLSPSWPYFPNIEKIHH